MHWKLNKVCLSPQICYVSRNDWQVMGGGLLYSDQGKMHIYKINKITS